MEKKQSNKNQNRKPFLYPHQKEALNRMFNGCVLNGTVGSGKSRTGLYYYFSMYGGSIDPNYVPMTDPVDLYIITTAKKKNDMEWEREMVPFLLYSPDEEDSFYPIKGAGADADDMRVCQRITHNRLQNRTGK